MCFQDCAVQDFIVLDSRYTYRAEAANFRLLIADCRFQNSKFENQISGNAKMSNQQSSIENRQFLAAAHRLPQGWWSFVPGAARCGGEGLSR
jgi:hypothetical protein